MTFRIKDTISTEAERGELIRQYAEEGMPAVVQQDDFRIWILTEDDRGDHWAWSWREENGSIVPVESLRLPLTVLHIPGLQNKATDSEVEYAYQRGHEDGYWNGKTTDMSPAEAAAFMAHYRSGLLKIPAPSRDEITFAVGGVLWDSMNYPVPEAVLGRDISFLRNKVVDAVMAILMSGRSK